MSLNTLVFKVHGQPIRNFEVQWKVRHLRRLFGNITLLYPDYAFLPFSFWEETEKENGEWSVGKLICHVAINITEQVGTLLVKFNVKSESRKSFV